MTRPVPQPAELQPPWLRQPPIGRFVLISFLFLLAMLMLITGIAALALGGYLLLSPASRPFTLPIAIGGPPPLYFATGAGEIVIALVIIAMTRKQRLSATSYEPKNVPNVHPRATGEPFPVQFQESPLGASFSGKGTVTFGPDALVISGIAPMPNPEARKAQPASFLNPTSDDEQPSPPAPPAIIKVSQTLSYSYHTIKSVQLQRVTVHMALSGSVLSARFTIPSSQGERLYRELATHFPQTVQEHRDWITNVRLEAPPPPESTA